jgi:hypothetical protein
MTRPVSGADRPPTAPESRWWVAADGEPQGPFSVAYISAALDSGRLAKDTLVCPVGGNAWRQADEWPHLINARGSRVRSPDVASAPAAAPSLTLPLMGIALAWYAIAVQPALFLLYVVSLGFGSSSATDLPENSTCS